MTKPTWWVAGGAVAVLVGALAVVGLLGGDEQTPPDTRARQYTEFDACLLTGEQGIAQGTPAASVWTGMQDASLETRARVTYVPVTGAQSTANVRAFLNSLIQRQCEVIVAVGAAQSEVTRDAAEAHPDVRFVAVDGAATPSAGSTPANLTTADPGPTAAETVADVIRKAVEVSGDASRASGS